MHETTPATAGMHAPEGVAAARTALLQWVDAAGAQGRTFLQVRLLATGGGRYEARHVADAGRPLRELAHFRDPYAAREIAQTTAAGDHRPLKTSPTLRRGWILAELDGRELWTALDYLYPACAMHWYAGRHGTLRVTHWREAAARQSGMYSSVKLLPAGAVRNAVRACCGDAVCLRRVAWEVDEQTPLELADEAPAPGAHVPCPEACSLFVAFARQVLAAERAPRRTVPGLGELSDADLAQIRIVIAEAAAGTLGAAREGDFAEPTNQRLVRYLAARLAEAAAEQPARADADLPCEGCPRASPCAACPLVER